MGLAHIQPATQRIARFECPVHGEFSEELDDGEILDMAPCRRGIDADGVGCGVYSPLVNVTTTSPHAAAGPRDAGAEPTVSPVGHPPAAAAAAPLDGAWFALNTIEIGKFGLLR